MVGAPLANYSRQRSLCAGLIRSPLSVAAPAQPRAGCRLFNDYRNDRIGPQTRAVRLVFFFVIRRAFVDLAVSSGALCGAVGAPADYVSISRYARRPVLDGIAKKRLCFRRFSGEDDLASSSAHSAAQWCVAIRLFARLQRTNNPRALR